MAPSTNQTPSTPAQRKQIHQEYYSQFVTSRTIAHLRRVFTADELVEALAADEHLNSIPLAQWDALTWKSLTDEPASYRRSGRFVAVLPFDRTAAKEAGETITRAVLVYIAKAAARIIVDTATAADTSASAA